MKELRFKRVASLDNLTGVAWYAAPVPGGHVLAAHLHGKYCVPCFVPDGAPSVSAVQIGDKRIEYAASGIPAELQPATVTVVIDRTAHQLQRKDASGKWRTLQMVHKPKLGDVVRIKGDTQAYLVIGFSGASGLLVSPCDG
jgi:hypothetical protein